MTEFSELERKTLDSQYFIRGIVPEWDSKIDEFSYESQMRREKGNCHLDIPYGGHSRQVLDVFKPQNQKPGALPVFVFFHGGYWRMLDKSNFGNIAFAGDAIGAITVIVNYRLLPDFGLENIVQDCCEATRWVIENIREFDGNPREIVLCGHSAGAQLGAQVSADIGKSFKGFIGISGVYDLSPIQKCFLNDIGFLGNDLVNKYSAHLAISSLPCPGHFFYGEKEPLEFQRQSKEQATFWRRPGSDAFISCLDGENHATILEQLMTPKSKILNSLKYLLGA